MNRSKISYAQRAIAEQENAAWWAAQARLYALDYRCAEHRHLGLAGHFQSNATAAQAYAEHSAGMARYWMGIDTLPTAL